MKRILTLALLIVCISVSVAQEKPKDPPINWEKYDLNAENKIEGSGKAFKKMLKGKNFIANFSIQQVTEAMGQLSNQEQSRSGTNIKSFVALGGVSSEKYQALVDMLHADFIKRMADMGIKFEDGSEVLADEFVQSKVDGKNVFAGHSPIPPTEYSLGNSTMLGGPSGFSKSAVSYHPSDYNYVIDSREIGNGYYRMTAKSGYNFVFVSYQLTFADFEGSAKSNSSKLNTSPLIMVTPKIGVMNADGGYSWIVYGKYVYGNRNWLSDEGISEGGTHKNILGAEVKGGYVMNADEDKYIDEITRMLTKVQESMLTYVKGEL